MNTDYVVLIEESFFNRIEEWEIYSKIELDVFQSLLREYGLDAIRANFHCAIEDTFFNDDGSERRIDFWIKISRTWMFLSLKCKTPTRFVLTDRKRLDTT